MDRVTNDVVPRKILLTEIEKVSKIDMAKLTNLFRGADTEFPRNELYWTVNYDRFLVEFRLEFSTSELNLCPTKLMKRLFLISLFLMSL